MTEVVGTDVVSTQRSSLFGSVGLAVESEGKIGETLASESVKAVNNTLKDRVVFLSDSKLSA